VSAAKSQKNQMEFGLVDSERDRMTKSLSTEELFVLMDPTRKVILRGTTGNRWACFVDDDDGRRFLTYKTAGAAISAYKTGYFQYADGVRSYLLLHGGDFLEPVKVRVTLNIDIAYESEADFVRNQKQCKPGKHVFMDGELVDCVCGYVKNRGQ
jgi:hypothetical protein